MRDDEDSLVECAKTKLQAPCMLESLEAPRALFSVLLIVIAFIALVATRGRFQQPPRDCPPGSSDR